MPTAAAAWDVAAVRRQFPALAARDGAPPPVFLDGPAGSQVPRQVADRVADYLLHTNANHGGRFATSIASDAMLAEAHQAVADLLGAPDPESVVFGANMTTLTFSFSRALARTWSAGDEIIVTQLDHDANLTPWVLAAHDAGATVHQVPVRLADCTLDLDRFAKLLSPRTRLVAVGAASNSVGTINPVADIVHQAHAVGAEVYVDAVHFAPHGLIDVAAWECDYLACSAYKFFGPHVGILWGRRELLQTITPYKVRPAANRIPDRWMTGTQNHEGIAGTLAAVDYLASLADSAVPAASTPSAVVNSPTGTAVSPRRAALVSAFSAITRYEQSLSLALLDILRRHEELTLYGVADPSRVGQRVPTFSVTHRRLAPSELAEALAQRGIYTWHGNYYALALSQALGREPEGMVRLGCLHYNTLEELARLDDALNELAR